MIKKMIKKILLISLLSLTCIVFAMDDQKNIEPKLVAHFFKELKEERYQVIIFFDEHKAKITSCGVFARHITLEEAAAQCKISLAPNIIENPNLEGGGYILCPRQFQVNK